MSEKKMWGLLWIGMILIQFLPMITTKRCPYGVINNLMLAGKILENNFLQYLTPVYLPFKIIPVVFIVLFIWKRKVTKYYLIYVGSLYLVYVFAQNIGINEEYGVGFNTPSIVMCIFVGVVWLYEAIHCTEEYVFRKKEWYFYLLLPLCVIAFWDPPVDHTIMGISMRFTLHNFFFSFAGIAECMMTAIIVTIYLFTHDHYENRAFKLSCMVGIFRGVENMGLALLYINSDRGAALAWIITHMPLLIISFTGYMLTLKRKKINLKKCS